MSSSISSSRRFAIAFAAVFCVAGLVFVVASEALVRWQVAPNSNLDQRKLAFQTSVASTAAFGDSRVVSGIIADAKFANFAGTGDNLETILGKLDAYLASGRARRVVLQAAPHQFALYRLNSDQSERLREFLGSTDRVMQMLRPQFRQYLFQYWQAILREPARLLGSPAPKPKAATPAAMPVFARFPEEKRRRDAMIRVQLQLPVRGFAASREMQHFRDTVARVRDSGADICLVTFPASAAYRAAAAKFPEFAEVREFYRELARDHGVTYIDLWDGYDDRQFENPDHLNADGARKLTDDVRRYCFGEVT